MTDRDSVIDIASPVGNVRLRPEREADRDFRYALFYGMEGAGRRGARGVGRAGRIMFRSLLADQSDR